MTKKLQIYTALFVICSLSILFQFDTLNQFPQYIHSWAQCDRYALALGFIDNGGDLFHPQTYVMNNQFPGEFMIPRNTSITSVDFPIHDYLVSFIMRVAHSTEPWCFRLYILVYAIVGLFFLYKLSALFTASLTRSLFVVLFAMSSPVFLYYQAGFLPTIPSLANAMIGLYFFTRFLKDQKRNLFYLAVFFITLAAMARLPFAILLVALMCFEFLNAFHTRRFQFFKLFAFLISIACILLYYLYNEQLREKYGSLFLNYIIPASSVSDLLDFTKTAAKKWTFQYFNVLAYVLFGMVVMGVLLAMFKKKISFNSLEKQFLLLVSIAFGGCCLYYLLMCYQFMNHDYYFLDTFYLPVVALFLFFVVKWPSLRVPKALGALSLLIFVPIFVFSKQKLNERIALSDMGGSSTAENYKNASQLLDSLKIPVDAKLLVFGSDGSNNAFILLKRKGFVMIEPESQKIDMALQWPYDYIVADDEKMISTVYEQYPQIIQRLVKTGGNGLISVYQRAANLQKDMKEHVFFELDKKKVLFHEQESLKFSILDSLQEYGYTFRIVDHPALKRKTSLLQVTCHVESNEALKDLLMCVSIKHQEKDLFFAAKDLGAKTQDKGGQDYHFLFVLPKAAEAGTELKVFMWNRGKNNLQYDGFQVTIY